MSGRSRRKKLVRSKRLKESVSAALEQEADDLVDPQPPLLRPISDDELLVNSELTQPSDKRDRSQSSNPSFECIENSRCQVELCCDSEKYHCM